MKLYATVESERASKGQGGNKFLKVIVSVGSADDSKPIAWILAEREANGYSLRLTPLIGEGITQFIDDETLEKGKKKTADIETAFRRVNAGEQ